MISRFQCIPLACGLLLLVSCGEKSSRAKNPGPADLTLDSSSAKKPDGPKGVRLGSKEGRFSIYFPEGFTTPMQDTMEMETPAGKLPVTLYMAQQDTTSAYIVAYSDYPGHAFDAGVEAMLNSAPEAALKTYNGIVEKRSNVTLNGHTGRSLVFRGTVENRTVFGRADYFIVKPRIYEILFLTSDSARVTSPEITAGFNSFTFERDTTAAATADSTKADSAKAPK
jgi:hypothetical protein